jgi:hypothetical protein
VIVIGDVHGRYDLLMKLIDKFPKGSELYFVGDLIDRGPDSKQVVDFVKDNAHKCVKGNHEDMMVQAFGDRSSASIWMQNGGGSTLDSFSNDSDRIREEYLPWFRSLPLIGTYKDFLISHSYALRGIDTEDDVLMWNRTCPPPKGDFRSVFGHTPHKEVHVYHDNHWCIDTGAFHTGILSAIDLDTLEIYNTKECEK